MNTRNFRTAADMNTSLEQLSHDGDAKLVSAPLGGWQTAAIARSVRVTPIVLLMLASLALPMLRNGWLWVTLLQIVTAAGLLLAHRLRQHLVGSSSIACLILLTVVLATQSLEGAHLAVRVLLSVTLALCVVHVCLRVRLRSSLRHGVCITSYVSGTLLLFVCCETATPAQSQLVAWIIVAACATCCAFIPWVEVKTMPHSMNSGGPDALDALPAPRFATLQARLQQLEEENDVLRSSKRDQESFVYAISHDLRAPLRAIDAFSRLLSDHLTQPLTPRARHDLAGIHAGVGRMQDLLNCWLNIARCERAVLRRTKVDLSVIAESLARELQMLDPKRSVIMTVDADLTASADPVLVRELLQNLLSNAWKFTRESTPATVHVGARLSGGETVFYVRDNGVGFDASQAAELFVPFSRLGTAARFAGTGVGLAIAQRIVERHQGRIWAEGELGRGATFHFTLTAAPSND